jgi:RNA polymerase sigma-70 factor (ECF subfamily)
MPADALLVSRIHASDESAWRELISRFEGRLLAFVESRVRDRSAAEDIVQETLIGFLNSVANYDDSRSLETYLFSIAAHKLTDHLRRTGRRPAIPMSVAEAGQSSWDVPGSQRAASALYRSEERRGLEEAAIIKALGDEIARWKQRGDWTKLKCIELLVVRGLPNKDVAAALNVSEQQVANFKFDFVSRLKTLLARQDLPEEVFPELASE